MTDRLPFAGILRPQAGTPLTRLGPYDPEAPVPAQRPGSRADEALAKIYEEQYAPLAGLAALLIWAACPPAVLDITEVTPHAQEPPGLPAPAGGREAGSIPGVAGIGTIPSGVAEIAEEIVHEALAAMHREWHRLRDAERALAYLRRSIVHEARAQGRAPLARRRPSGAASHDSGLSAMSGAVLAALRRLPGRQREALVLRYYANLPEAAAADAMGVTRAAFRGHATRAMVALRHRLDQESCG